jgi:hypothetical protein
MAGAAGGVAIAYWGVSALRGASPANLPRVDEMRVDGRALLFALGAGSHDVVGLVMRDGITPAALGTMLGHAAAAGLTRVLQGMLYGARVGPPERKSTAW